MKEPAARTYARFAAQLKLADIPAPVVERAKRHILDGLGLGLAATTMDFGRAALAGALATGDCGTSSVIGCGDKLTVRDAAMVNGVLIHGLDFDDTHLGSIIHATATALPAALAVGEAVGASGAAMLTAFLAGAELAIRIGLAVKGGFHHTGFHATGVVSHFASAVTAGLLLGLDEDQLVAAQGIAGSTASGIQVFLEEGAWTKRLHPGWGAVAGITAAHLAKAGFTGPSRPYEGKFGLFDTHLDTEFDVAEIAADLGQVWHFGDTALKPYPVCHFSHGCIDAAIALHGELAGAAITPEKIIGVDAYLPEPTLHIVAEPHAAKANPTNEYEVKFSAQFVTAYSLIHGRFGLPDLLPEAMADARGRDLAQRVACHIDPYSQFPTYFSGGLRVALADGRVLARHVPINSGAGERAMTADAVAEKFYASASLAICREQAEAVAGAVMGLENGEVQALMQVLRLPR